MHTMTYARIIDAEEIEQIVKDCWASDEEPLSKYHVCAGQGLDKCVGSTINVLLNNTDKSFKFYKVIVENELFGFFGAEDIMDGFLTTFFVMPKYRTKEWLEHYTDMIDGLFGKQYHTSIYDHNTRAEQWLLKTGFKMIHKIDNVLIFKQVITCH